MSSIAQRETSLMLGIIVEKRASSHPWADVIWRPVAVYLVSGAGPAPWTVLRESEGVVRYHAGTLPLVLHRKDTEALCLNLMLDHPELYVVLQENDAPESAFPYVPHLVTASSYQSQDYDDTGNDLIEKLPMPEAVAAFVQAFVDLHHVEVPFKKRRRDRLDVEEQKFGKAPVFLPLTRH